MKEEKTKIIDQIFMSVSCLLGFTTSNAGNGNCFVQPYKLLNILNLKSENKPVISFCTSLFKFAFPCTSTASFYWQIIKLMIYLVVYAHRFQVQL